ncbi:hypothetical protein [Lysinibacillus sphaericus]|uniref:hypothetical protein n=1 Tax=Lysinibacillus sphaericus TaxID=1421 RepID=UPI0004DF5295|nr:hypothetical protein [Lysinibacillus sphaericus]QPA58349.1 hypothetical protein INQ55_20150 [Lysinibacillus sphaericus]
MFEGMSEEEKALAEQIIQNMRGESEITNNVSAKKKTISKEERFDMLCDKRLNKAIKALEKISNLSVTARHAYSEEKVDYLIEKLEDEVATIKVLFQRGVTRQEKQAEKLVATPKPFNEEE